MKQILKLSIIISIILSAMTFSGCNNNNVTLPELPDNLCYDFVTFVSSGEKGSVFEFRKNGDSELITLTAAVKIDQESLKPGTRVIIQYLPSGGQQPYQSGAIDLYGIAQIINGKPVEKTLAEINANLGEPLTMKTIARSGNYIDIWADGYGAGTEISLDMYIDKASADSDYPEAYLIYTFRNMDSGRRQIYASFDINDILSRSDCKGLKITYRTNTGFESVRFDKDTLLPIDPTE